jgi:polar amino acid transport system permease protein
MNEALRFILQSSLIIGEGMLVTIGVTIASILLGLVVGIPLAVGRVYGNKVLQQIIQVYEGFFRGAPLIVVLFIFYFGLRDLPFDISIGLSPPLAAIISLGLIASAYLSLVFRGAIQSISKEQYDAARSLGMGKWQAIFQIVLVQAFRLAIPGFANEFTIVLKDSPITYAVGIPEMLTQARGIIDAQMGKVFFEVLIPVAVLYYILFALSNKLLNILDKKLEIPGYEAERSE